MGRAQVTIDHRWSNTDAQSLIGLPMGSHKTIVDRQGNLKWSQWSLKRRPLDSPIGFSDQLDGELAIQAFAGSSPLSIDSQELYRGGYPFIVSKTQAGGLSLEELAFAVDQAANAFLRVEPAFLRDPHFALSCAQREVASSQEETPFRLLTLAWAYRANGQIEKSKAAAEQGLALLPVLPPGKSKPNIRKLLEYQARRDF